MSTATFDSLQAARDLEKTGLERAQAEAIAQAIQRRSQDYATKADIAALRSEIVAVVEKAKNAVLLAVLAATGLIIASVGLFA